MSLTTWIGSGGGLNWMGELSPKKPLGTQRTSRASSSGRSEAGRWLWTEGERDGRRVKGHMVTFLVPVRTGLGWAVGRGTGCHDLSP